MAIYRPRGYPEKASKGELGVESRDAVPPSATSSASGARLQETS